jgi:hypothetical protein
MGMTGDRPPFLIRTVLLRDRIQKSGNRFPVDSNHLIRTG